MLNTPTSQLLLLQDILHTSFISNIDSHRSALQVSWSDSLELNIIQLVKSYTGGQTAVENMRMVDDHACNSPIGTHLRARDNKP